MALSHLDNVSETVIETVAEQLVDWLEVSVDAPPKLVDRLLRTLRRAPSIRTRVAAIACGQLQNSRDHNVCAAYFASLFIENANIAISMLEDALATVDDGEQTALVEACLSAISDDLHVQHAFTPPALVFADLKRFVIIAYSKVHPEADHNRLSGVVYSPDQRDKAEEVRNSLFKTLTETPGLATYRALGDLRQKGDFPIPDYRMREFERVRAEADSELDRWSSSDVLSFRSDFHNRPATAQDLQRAGLIRLEEIAHDLLHGDFNQGFVVARLENETAVQNWFASRLQSLQGQCYTVEREVHVADEREPDLRLSSRISDARCPLRSRLQKVGLYLSLERPSKTSFAAAICGSRRTDMEFYFWFTKRGAEEVGGALIDLSRFWKSLTISAT